MRALLTSLVVVRFRFRRKSVAELRLLSGRTHAEREMSFEVLWWAVPVVLSFMPLHNVLQIVGAALTEHKVGAWGWLRCRAASSRLTCLVVPGAHRRRLGVHGRRVVCRAVYGTRPQLAAACALQRRH